MHKQESYVIDEESSLEMRNKQIEVSNVDDSQCSIEEVKDRVF